MSATNTQVRYSILRPTSKEKNNPTHSNDNDNNYYMKLIFTTLLLTVIFSSTYAQVSDIDSSAWFMSRHYGKYFKADHYAPNMRISGGVSLREADYNIDVTRTGKFIPINETVLGGDIPIYQKLWKNSALSFSMPLSFSVWFDFTETLTAPILNTDYRFALVEIDYLHKFNHPTFRNVVVKYIPFFHESTHIGDELTIARINADATIVRINVSYESTNLSFTINDPLNQDIKNHSFKLGAKLLLNPSKGWYSFNSFEGDTSLVSPSKRWIEPYLQYQYQNPDCFFSFGNSLFVFSTDLSYRVKFGYPYHEYEGGNFQITETSEQHLPSLNVMAGWHFYNSKNDLSNVGLYLQAYSGLNYHGQFRNLPNYQFYGITVMYDL